MTPSIILSALLAGSMLVGPSMQSSGAVVSVDITEFRAAHVARGGRAAEADIRDRKYAYYLDVCAFPGMSKEERRRLQFQKRGLSKLGVTPREHDTCNDIIDQARRSTAFKEGYNAVSRAALSMRFGEKSLRKLGL